MLKKFAFLFLAVGLFHVSGLLPPAFAETPVSAPSLCALAGNPGEMKFPTQADPLSPINNTCTAEQTCPSPFDGPIMCMGNSSCQVFSYQVSCDGNIVDCPCSIAPSGCDDPLFYCVCRSQGGTFNYCRTQFC